MILAKLRWEKENKMLLKEEDVSVTVDMLVLSLTQLIVIMGELLLKITFLLMGAINLDKRKALSPLDRVIKAFLFYFLVYS